MTQPQSLNVQCADDQTIVLRRYARDGAPRLFLSHGNGFAIAAYRCFWELLAPDFELCLFDQRNHGVNPLGPIERHTLAAMAQDHLDVRRAADEAFGSRMTVGLFHSIASIAAIRAAAELGATWDALILFDPPLVAPPGDPLRETSAKLDSFLENLARQRPSHFAGVEEYAAQIAQRMGRTWVEGAAFDMARATTRPAADGGVELACPGDYEAQIYGENFAFGSFEALGAMRQPTLLICADASMPRAMAPAFAGPAAAKKFGLDCVVVPGSSHMLQLEKPDEVAAIARKYISRTLG